MTDVFNSIFDIVIGIEGDLSLDPNDPGNWTGGEIGKGDLNGTKYGISAAAYPNLDIKNLTVQQASTLYYNREWKEINGDQLFPAFALLVFDAAVNNGPGVAGVLFQEMLGVNQDGIIGPLTIKAMNDTVHRDVLWNCMTYLRLRLRYYESLNNERFIDGWTNRLFNLAYHLHSFVGVSGGSQGN